MSGTPHFCRALALAAAWLGALAVTASAAALDGTEGAGRATPGPPVPQAAQVRSADPVMLEGRLLVGHPLTWGRFGEEQIELMGQHRIRSQVHLALYMDLAFLKRWPKLLDDQRLAHDYARRFLLGQAYSRFIARCAYGSCGDIPYDGWAGADEFEREATWRNFVRRYRPILIDMAPELPVHLTKVVKVTVQPYDKTRGVFPLRPRHVSSLVFGSFEPVASPRIDAEFSAPAAVPVAAQDAPSFLDELDPERTAFLRLQLSLVEPRMSPTGLQPRFRLTMETAELYADPDLRRKVHDFSLWSLD